MIIEKIAMLGLVINSILKQINKLWKNWRIIKKEQKEEIRQHNLRYISTLEELSIHPETNIRSMKALVK